MPPMHPGRGYSHDAYDADMSRSMHNGFAQTSAHAPTAQCSPNSASQLAHQRHSASYAEVRLALYAKALFRMPLLLVHTLSTRC